MKIDFHIHTAYSSCSSIKIPDLIDKCVLLGINAIAITDHNSIEGALIARNNSRGIEIIIGEEISTKQGEIIGLFLEEFIPPTLSIEETIEQIKSQRGLVYIPHPFARLKFKSIPLKILNNLIEKIDIIEIYNAKLVFLSDNCRAEEFASKNNLFKAGGSDSHTLDSVGRTYVEIDANKIEKESILNYLRNPKIIFGRTNPLSPLWAKVSRLFMRQKFE